VYGALIGDAVGVPYEFKPPSKIPAYLDIDMIPPPGYPRSWSAIPTGTYSDDGAQVLCLLEHLATSEFDGNTFYATLQRWLEDGYMASGGVMFDCGNQTMAALRNGHVEALNEERFNGNGSLMRALPVALVCDTPDEICKVSFLHSSVTHPHIRSKLCCALYSLVVHFTLNGWHLPMAITLATNHLNSWLVAPEDIDELNYIIDCASNDPKGSGYVVDSLWSALYAVKAGYSYRDTIKMAILLGNDTDTTACIAGGLAAIIHGYDSIPEDWVAHLKGKDNIDQVLSLLNSSV
jgi:ADP-ribosylglycohydrolase